MQFVGGMADSYEHNAAETNRGWMLSPLIAKRDIYLGPAFSWGMAL